MNRIAVFAVLVVLTGSSATPGSQSSSLNLLRLLMERPWLFDHLNRERPPLTSEDVAPNQQTYRVSSKDEEYPKNYVDDVLRASSTKRSAVATALNGRRRRQPAPALGKTVTPYVGVGSSATPGSQSSSLNLLRLLMERPWLFDHLNRERPPLTSEDVAPNQQTYRVSSKDEEYPKNYVDDVLRASSTKRSAVATALNGRRRRQPAPALGKTVTPYVGVGVLNDVGTFFDTLRDNLETLASLSPQQRSSLFHSTPSVVQASMSGSGGGGSGMRRLHALRPLRPTSNIRSYNRRSFIDPDGGYPGANHHDPGLLWTGLGRR